MKRSVGYIQRELSSLALQYNFESERSNRVSKKKIFRSPNARTFKK